MNATLPNKESTPSNGLESITLDYFAIRISQFVASSLFLSVGIVSLIYYDYGLLVFLFALPQFVVVGAVPLLIGILILIKAILECEHVSIEKDEKGISIKTSKLIRRLKVEEARCDVSTIKYLGLRYREHKTFKWAIVALLTLLTLEVIYQNAVDLYGHARLGLILWICFFLNITGIILLIFSPRRFLEIGTTEELVYVPYTVPKKARINKTFQISGLELKNYKHFTIFKRILRNIKVQPMNTVMGAFFVGLGVFLLLSTSIFFGSFARTLALLLGLKLLEQALIGDRFLSDSQIDKESNLFQGASLRSTFLKKFVGKTSFEPSFSVSRFHAFEIMTYAYFIAQSIKYAFRFVWFHYADFSLFYFSIGIIVIGLIFVRWFDPNLNYAVTFEKFTLTAKGYVKESLQKKIINFFANFKEYKQNKDLLLSGIIFEALLAWPILYFLYGGNFLLI